MNKNYPIYQTTFIDDMRALVEEAAQNFGESTAISYKDNPWDKEVKRYLFRNGAMMSEILARRLFLMDLEKKKLPS